MCKHICGAQANHEGRVVAQAFSRLPVTLEARFRISCGKCGGSDTGTCLSKKKKKETGLLWLSPAIIIPPVPHAQDLIHLPPALHNPSN